jgi:hypothetical protein
MEAEEPQRAAWALDVSRLDSSDVIEGLKRAEQEPETSPSETGGGAEHTGGQAREPVDPTAPVEDGGMGISDEEINSGVGEIFDGLTKIASGALGQDITPTDSEKVEAGQKLGPLVQKRFPTVRRYTLETAALLWVLGYLNDKTNVAELMK